MKVLFLGAGCSMPAGYPSTAALYPTMLRDFTEYPEVGLRAAWRRYASFRRSARGVLGRVVRSSNPEVSFTLLDLLRTATDSSDQAAFAAAVKALGSPSASSVSVRMDKYWEGRLRSRMKEADAALANFLTCLGAFFARRHHEDRTEEGYDRRAYLRSLFADLTEGDVVLTTNWDTLPERTLMDLGRWVPTDGYGFPRRLRLAFARHSGRPDRLPRDFAKVSGIKVLKLHGSFGWRSAGETPYLEGAWLLHSMPFRHGAKTLVLEDTAQPDMTLPYHDYILAYPSFLKQLPSAIMQDIWAQASSALSRATEVVAIGYSLPASDIAVRVLLNPLRSRKVKITVYNPDREACARWRSFLPGCNIRQRAYGSR